MRNCRIIYLKELRKATENLSQDSQGVVMIRMGYKSNMWTLFLGDAIM